MGRAVVRRLVKDGIELCRSLGFNLDQEDRKLRTDRWRFTHANEPETVVKFDVKMSELAAQAQIQTAKRIVGLAVSDGKPKAPPKASQRAKAERSAERQRRETAIRLAQARRDQEAAQRAAVGVLNRQRELEQLLRGGRRDSGRATAASIHPAAMLSVAEVADQTGLTDKAVARAIESGSLEAYMCGGQIKVRGADVRAWITTP